MMQDLGGDWLPELNDFDRLPSVFNFVTMADVRSNEI